MANVTNDGSSNVSVTFTDDEKEVLLKAKEIIGDLSKKLLINGNEEHDKAPLFFTQMSDNLENVLEGKYDMF